VALTRYFLPEGVGTRYSETMVSEAVCCRSGQFKTRDRLTVSSSRGGDGHHFQFIQSISVFLAFNRPPAA